MPGRSSAESATREIPCIFCDIVARQAPVAVVAENEVALAFLTIGPLREGHTLVIPKRHAVELPEATPAELSAVITLMSDVARRQREALGSTGENVFLASGVDAEQSVFHLHFHVVPRRPGDDVALAGWWATKMLRPLPDRAALDRVARALRGGN